MDPAAHETLVAALVDRERALSQVAQRIVDAEHTLGGPPPGWQGRAADAYATRRHELRCRIGEARADLGDALLQTRGALAEATGG